MRGFDSIHLASALLIRKKSNLITKFACFDQALNRVAVQEGLEVPFDKKQLRKTIDTRIVMLVNSGTKNVLNRFLMKFLYIDKIPINELLFFLKKLKNIQNDKEFYYAV